MYGEIGEINRERVSQQQPKKTAPEVQRRRKKVFSHGVIQYIIAEYNM
jgi:hypothetical protein